MVGLLVERQISASEHTHTAERDSPTLVLSARCLARTRQARRTDSLALRAEVRWWCAECLSAPSQGGTTVFGRRCPHNMRFLIDRWRRIGVRLYLALGIAVFLTLVSAAVGVYYFEQSGDLNYELESESVPALEASWGCRAGGGASAGPGPGSGGRVRVWVQGLTGGGCRGGIGASADRSG